MSHCYYIGSPRELPLGERGSVKSAEDKSGSKPIKSIRFKSAVIPEGSIPLDQILDLSHVQADETAIYDSPERAAGIIIRALQPWNEMITRHFTNSYVCELYPNWGKFNLSPLLMTLYPEEYEVNLKCIKELFRLIQDYGKNHETFEIYTCSIGNERRQKNDAPHRVIDLAQYRIEDYFHLREEQYVQVRT
ncbi:hypothetical protein ACFQI7_07665 [Paenibacillus allorhizosphaerae]|uniref:Uncharacterized protein n=1 Tax=Paenibacillus allorhizosphaerae TaxID=2849866 RepID=A0ABM8VG73_9BACL|nr:hypothetical protein [Paenibacillus allorhizosphaerae]CAG7637368.1 hypothetical protein PAECIP111802_02350 [Paenibacillus allorhizosphaerae]